MKRHGIVIVQQHDILPDGEIEPPLEDLSVRNS